MYPNCGLFAEKGIPIVVQLKDFAWLLGRTLGRTVTEENAEEVERGRDEQNVQCDAVSSVHLPVWSGYNSLIHNTMPVTRVSCPPLVAAPAHEWKTLLTILMQAQAGHQNKNCGSQKEDCHQFRYGPLSTSQKAPDGPE